MSEAFTIRLEEDELTDGWIATVEEMPGVVDQGGSIAEALLNIGEAIEFTIEADRLDRR